LNTIKNNEEIKNLYDELWNKLQDHDEIYAKKILNDCLEKLDKKQSKETIFNTLMVLLKKPMFWIGLIAVVLIVPIIFALFIWVSLLIE